MTNTSYQKNGSKKEPHHLNNAGFATIALDEIDNEYGAAVSPIYRASLYKIKNPKEIMANEFIYSRLGNPNVQALEEKLAALEGGDKTYCFATGMAAITAFALALLKPGDHVICESIVYGGTLHLFESELLAQMNITVDFIDLTQPENLRTAVRPNTKLVYIESPTNPNLNVLDIKAISDIAHEHELHVAVDNTFATPYLQSPFELGADSIMHSLTKYVGGHSAELGGAVVLKDTQTAKQKAFSNKLYDTRTLVGSTMTADTAWQLNQGIKTLPVRLDKHCANALAIAKHLAAHPKVTRVIYPGLPSHPDHALAARQMKHGFGGVVTFEIEGGKNAVENVLSCIEKPYNVGLSLGGVETLIFSAQSIYAEMLGKHGITPGMIRLSVGIETLEDLISGLDRALDAACNIEHASKRVSF